MIGIRAIGWWLPEGRRDTAEIARDYGLSTQALEEIGLRSHSVAGDDDHPTAMGAKAVRHAINSAGLDPDDIDLLIYAGITKDWPTPYVGAFGVLHELGTRNTAGLDISTRCASGIDALWLAKTMIAAGSTYKTIAICCAERFDKLMGPPRRPELATDACYAAGAAAAIVQADTDNEICAFSCLTNPDLSIHKAMGPSAGGTRVSLSEHTLAKQSHLWQGQLSIKEIQAIAEYAVQADIYNYAQIMQQADFEKVDFSVCSPLHPGPQTKVLNRIGIDTSRQIFTVQTLGHIGPADLFLILGIAVKIEREIGKRIVLSTRTPAYSNAVAVRAKNTRLSIAVDGHGIDLNYWR